MIDARKLDEMRVEVDAYIQKFMEELNLMWLGDRAEVTDGTNIRKEELYSQEG